MSGSPTPPDQDPWDAARARTREQVREIFARGGDEEPLRTCPACGEQARTRFDRCPACGAAYFRRPPRFTRRRRLALAPAAAAALGAAAVLLGPGVLRGADERRADREAASAKLRAAERARLVRDQAPHRGRPEGLRPPPRGAARAEVLAARRALVGSLEADILRDVRARIARGELEGRARYVACGPLVRSSRGGRDTSVGDEEDPRRRIGRYDCVAVEQEVVREGRIVGRLGHPFVAAVDFRRFTYVWCKNNPPPGERGRPLAVVRLDRACLAARGPAVGTGYALEPGS